MFINLQQIHSRPYLQLTENAFMSNIIQESIHEEILIIAASERNTHYGPVRSLHLSRLFEKAPVTETTGVFVCPNMRCCQTNLARFRTNNCRSHHKIQEIIRMPQHRMTSTSEVNEDGQEIIANALENMPCLNLVDVRLTTFTSLRNSDKIYRQQQIIEIYGDYTMLQTLNVLKEYERLSSLDIANRIYYCPSGLINERSSWKRIRKDDLSMPITKFGQEDQHIDIIFDYIWQEARAEVMPREKDLPQTRKTRDLPATLKFGISEAPSCHTISLLQENLTALTANNSMQLLGSK
ncbi:hypothetical protein DINM_005235 [Dirofilaria immitis]|nr:hypothetical protein [Dirofilaria immitis]